MIKNFAELQERVRSSEPLVVSVAQAADQEVLLSVKAAADQGYKTRADRRPGKDRGTLRPHRA